jgi:hypothetical protein
MLTGCGVVGHGNNNNNKNNNNNNNNNFVNYLWRNGTQGFF